MTANIEKIKVLIVDDHQVVRQGLRTFLDLNEDILVVGEAVDGQEAVEMAAQLAPDIVLMDLVMPRLDGIAATSRIKSLGLGTKVIALTSFTEDDKVFPAIQAGASSYLLKDVSPDTLVEAIRAVQRGEARLHPEVMRKLMEQVAAQPGSGKPVNGPQLTEREGEVIRLVAHGKEQPRDRGNPGDQRKDRQGPHQQHPWKTGAGRPHPDGYLCHQERPGGPGTVVGVRLRQDKIPSTPVSRPTPIVLAAVCFFYVTVVLRTLAESDFLAAWLAAYLGLEFLFGVLFTLVLWRPIHRGPWLHLYFVFQSLLALFLLVLHPTLDFTNILLVLLCIQAALVFPGLRCWVWVAVLLLLIVLSLTILLGWYGLALSLLPAAVAIVLPAYVAITREIEAGQQQRQVLLAELQEANRRLTAYAGQVEELSAVQERNRLARELHDSVSQTMFSISLHSRSARILLERDPDRLGAQLQQLRILTQSALEEMRSLIADLRPHEKDSGEQPTS